MVERTLVLIKPDGVERGLIGEILTRFERAGFRISAMKLTKVDADFSKKHYAEHVGKKFYEGLETMITMGPVVAMAIEGVDVVENIRKMAGATEPKSAAPGTIRGDYCHVSYQHADERGISVKNVIHASSNKEDAARELELWFKSSEYFPYDGVHDRHVIN